MEIYGSVFALVCGDYRLIRNSCLMVFDVLHMFRKEDSRTKLEENYGEKNNLLCHCIRGVTSMVKVQIKEVDKWDEVG